ncbi:hypothetical protein IEO21_06684 [Rhodonia placenta]|uniref:Uncharacterized protein n=1 Tax=Rhodonia placenta TaxID=104341 RepID=A0A8H7NZK9_9APHY|nr:hypothetical protein IEO21_06684 [Postia placenta]
MGNNASVAQQDAEADMLGLLTEVERGHPGVFPAEPTGYLSEPQVQRFPPQVNQALFQVPIRSSPSSIHMPGSFPTQTAPAPPPVPSTNHQPSPTYYALQAPNTTPGIYYATPADSRQNTHSSGSHFATPHSQWSYSSSPGSWIHYSPGTICAPPILPVSLPQSQDAIPYLPPGFIPQRIISPDRDTAPSRGQSLPPLAGSRSSSSIRTSSNVSREQRHPLAQSPTVHVTLYESPRSTSPTQSPGSGPPASTAANVIHNVRFSESAEGISDGSPDVQYISGEGSPTPPIPGRLSTISEAEEPCNSHVQLSVESPSSAERSASPALSSFEDPRPDSRSSHRSSDTHISSTSSLGDLLKPSPQGGSEHIPLAPELVAQQIASLPAAMQSRIDLSTFTQPLSATDSSQSADFIPPRFSPAVNGSDLWNDFSASPIPFPSSAPLVSPPAPPGSPFYQPVIPPSSSHSALPSQQRETYSSQTSTPFAAPLYTTPPYPNPSVATFATTPHRSPWYSAQVSMVGSSSSASPEYSSYASFQHAPHPNCAIAAGFCVGTPFQNVVIQPDQPPHSVPTATGGPMQGLFVKAFRGSTHIRMVVDTTWDDAGLFREMGKTYDKLRAWRKWTSLKSVRSITLVRHDEKLVYPQRVGPKRVSRHRQMRLRYYLQHPDELKDSREFMQVLIQRPDLSIEFLERWQASRIGLLLLVLVFLSLAVGIIYTETTGDVSSGFTIASYMTSAYSVCLVLIGVLNLVDL